MSAFLLANRAIMPEMFLFFMSAVVLLTSVFTGDRCRHMVHGLTQFALWGSVALAFYGIPDQTTVLYASTFIVDHLALVLKVSGYVSAALLCFYSIVYLEDAQMPRGEFYALALLSTLGMSVLISAHHFITLFVGLELLSLPLYAMIAMHRNQVICLEAAIKYFIMGAIATGILLYGASLFYGGTQSLVFSEIARAMPEAMASNRLLIVFALVFMVSGIGFKLGVVPFHMWLPDVYEGAPTVMTMYVATISKIAALAMALRIFMIALPTILFDWQQLLWVLILLSLALGNIAAIVQTNLKRMLAYSAIAQMGYLLLGVYTGTKAGYDAAVFYTVSYVITTLAAFALIMCFRKRNGDEAVMIKDFSGLYQTHPWYAVMFMMVMFSLAGVPPLVGFIAKLQVFQALFQVGPFWLIITALLFTVVAAYYYIYVVKVMMFDEPTTALQVSAGRLMQPLLSLNAASVLLLGMMPSVLIAWCHV